MKFKGEDVDRETIMELCEHLFKLYFSHFNLKGGTGHTQGKCQKLKFLYVYLKERNS